MLCIYHENIAVAFDNPHILLLSKITFRVSSSLQPRLHLHSSSSVSTHFLSTTAWRRTMDQEMEIMEDLLVDEPSLEDYIDPEYEFDACQFFDFSRDETESESQEAESWFRYAHEYPPSPFIVKLKLMKAAKVTHMKSHKASSRKIEADRKTSTSSVSDGDIDHTPSREVKIKGVKHHNLIPQDSVKAKSKSTVNLSKPSGSSFMKPTASHLAKQNKECDMHSGGFGRLQKPFVNAGEKLRSPTRCQNLATKRQRLEIGYLLKVAQLKHRASFLHKNVKKVLQLEGNSNSRFKTTTPRKPALVTEERAHRRRSQNKSESDQQPKANPHAFKARPLNRKILDAPKLPQRQKSMTHLTDFQEFHLKTTERAMQVHSANVLYKQNSAPPMSEDIVIKRQNSLNSGKNEKCRSSNNLKACTTDKIHPIKDGGFILNAKHNSQLPPVELFKKLSLKSESETKIISSLRPPRLSKVLKENAPRSLKQEIRRCGGKSNQCGSDRRI